MYVNTEIQRVRKEICVMTKNNIRERMYFFTGHCRVPCSCLNLMGHPAAS